MRIQIGGKPYLAGLTWQLVESMQEVADLAADGGHTSGVILRRGRQVLAVGFVSADRGGQKIQPPSAAALAAICRCSQPEGEGVVVVERLGDGRYWLVAVIGGVVVPGTDLLLGDQRDVKLRLADLREAGQEYQIAGGAAAEFGGEVAPAFPGLTPKLEKKARPVPVSESVSPVAAVLLGILTVAAAGGIVWWFFLRTPDQPPPADLGAIVDQEAQRREQAIAARHAQVSADLSGFAPGALVRHALAAGQPLGTSADLWRFVGLDCRASESGGSCALEWETLDDGAEPGRLAAALQIPRERVTHDLAARKVSVAVPLTGQPESIRADASTPLDGSIPRLVDACKRLQRLGMNCTPTEATPLAIPDADLLPPELRYRRGTISLGGPLGTWRALDILGDLQPWVRADSVQITLNPTDFSLRVEAHYVVP